MAKTASQRTTDWRQHRIDCGWVRKEVLLPPAAADQIHFIRKGRRLTNDSDAIVWALAEGAKRYARK